MRGAPQPDQELTTAAGGIYAVMNDDSHFTPRVPLREACPCIGLFDHCPACFLIHPPDLRYRVGGLLTVASPLYGRQLSWLPLQKSVNAGSRTDN